MIDSIESSPSVLNIVARELANAFVFEMDPLHSADNIIRGKKSTNPYDAYGYIIEKYYFDNQSKFTSPTF
jgi:hypothetical protein